MKKYFFLIVFLLVTAFLTSGIGSFETERLFEVNSKRAYDNYRNYAFSSADSDFLTAFSYKKTFFFSYLYFKNTLRRNELKKAHEILLDTAENYGSENESVNSALNSFENVYIKKQKEENNFKFSYVNAIQGASASSARFYNPTGLAVDSSNNIYVCSFSTGSALVFNTNGVYLKTIYKGKAPYRIYADDDYVYITDFKDGSLNIINLNDDSVRKISSYSDKNMHGPQAVFADEDGNVYVSMSGSKNIVKFDAQGNFLLEITGFKMPADIKVNSGGIYVLDREDKKIIIYDRYGNLIRSINLEKSSSPYSFEILNGGFIVSDIIEGVLNYDLNGKLVNKAVSAQKQPLNILTPFYILKKQNNIYVADFNLNEIKIYHWGDLKKDENKYMLDVVNIHENFFPVIATEFAVRSSEYDKEKGINEANIKIYENDIRMHPVYVKEYEEYFKKSALFVGVEKGIEDAKLNRVMLDILKENTFFDIIPANAPDKNFYTYTEFIENKDKFFMGQKDYTAEFFNLLKIKKRKFLVFLVRDAAGFLRENNYLVKLAEQNYVPVVLIDFGRMTDFQNVNYFNFDLFQGRGFHEFLKEHKSGKYVAVYESRLPSAKSGSWRDLKYELNFLGVRAYDFFGYYTP